MKELLNNSKHKVKYFKNMSSWTCETPKNEISRFITNGFEILRSSEKNKIVYPSGIN